MVMITGAILILAAAVLFGFGTIADGGSGDFLQMIGAVVGIAGIAFILLHFKDNKFRDQKTPQDET